MGIVGGSGSGKPSFNRFANLRYPREDTVKKLSLTIPALYADHHVTIVKRLIEIDGGTVELRAAPEGGLDAVIRLRTT